MKPKIELLFWPGELAARSIGKVSRYSIELTKRLARRQIELGQATLRLVDPKEFVRHREQVGVAMEIESLKKELRTHNPKDPKYDQFVRFSSQTWLKLVGQWAEADTPVSRQGIEQVSHFLGQQGVHPEVIAGVMDQLQVEKPVDLREREIPVQPTDIEIYSPS